MIITAKPGTVTVIPATVQQPKPGQPYGKKLRVAAYCRVSSEKDEQLNSFDVQVSYYKEKIANNPEWKYAGIFADGPVKIGLNQKHPTARGALV